LGQVIRHEIAEGKLAFIDLNDYADNTSDEHNQDDFDTIEVNAPPSIMDFAGVFQGDTELAEIAKEAYRLRDELKGKEWGN
jgi:hypothetical protein